MARACAPALVGLCVAGPSFAYLERPVLSARSAAIGSAFASLADDPSAVVDNPAGLSGIPALSLLSTYRKPFGVDGLNEGYLAAVTPARVATVGASWFHRGLDGALSEDLVTLAVARDLKRTSEDASLSIGASLDLARVSAHGEFDDAAAAASFGAGVLLRPFAFIGLGYAIRNITEPRLDLVGAGGTPLRRAQAFALAYHWQDRLVVTLESFQDPAGEWKNGGGMELVLARSLTLRGGIEEGHAAVGFGVARGRFVLDGAMTSHETVGASYLVSVRYARAKGASPYATPR